MLLVDGTTDGPAALRRSLAGYKDGRLDREFALEHVPAWAELKYWYAHNRSRHVCCVIQVVEYPANFKKDRLLTPSDVATALPPDLSYVTYQGFLIYARLRQDNLDNLVPVILVAGPNQIIRAQQFSGSFLHAGPGACELRPGPLVELPCCTDVVETLDSIALRPFCPAEHEGWKARHGMVVGRSRRMMALVREIKRVGPTDAIVLLLGGPGTGKEVIAHALHRLSYRYAETPPERQRPKVIVIPAISRELVEDNLFGHEKGAFTGAVSDRQGIFETARGSTVFLDEIGDIAEPVQLMLMRAFEYHRIRKLGAQDEIDVDMRIIVATNRSVAELQTRFRPDFYSRLVQSCILVPSLTERWREEPDEVLQGDVAELAQFAVQQMNSNPRNIRPLQIDTSATGFLAELVRGYIAGTNDLFTGNIRTLRNIVERAYERAQFDGTPAIRTGHVISTIGYIQFTNARARARQPASVEQTVGSLKMADIERAAIAEALKKCDGNRTQAAELMEIGRDTLRRKITQYNLD